jgi:hypothetical protein
MIPSGSVSRRPKNQTQRLLWNSKPFQAYTAQEMLAAK